MRRRAVYRWKSFWLGVLVLVFLGWAWVRSMHREDHIEWGYSRGECISLEQVDGGLFLYRGFSPYSRLGFSYLPIAFLGEVSQGRPIELMKSSVGSHVKVAHWFLIALFLVPWSAWLLWQWKREQKDLTA